MYYYTYIGVGGYIKIKDMCYICLLYKNKYNDAMRDRFWFYIKNCINLMAIELQYVWENIAFY